MGGSGGGHFGGDVADTIRQIKKAQQQEHHEEYEANCNGFLNSLLTAFNDRDAEAINRHLEEIRRALEKKLEGTIDLVFGGSVAKHTYVDGLSDVDSLVLLDSCELAERSPREAKEYLASQLQERFPRTSITTGQIAVTIRFADAEIQLLPAVSCDNAVQIPDANGVGWSRIQPRKFTSELTAVNDKNGKKVVPAVKLAKAMIASLPEQQRVSGYHTEALAVEVFRQYGGAVSNKEMVRHFFTEASRRVLVPITDLTGQSLHVDEYLGVPQSLERKIVSDAFARIARRIERADASGRLDDWRALFGEQAGPT